MRPLAFIAVWLVGLGFSHAASLNVARGYGEIYWGAAPYDAAAPLGLTTIVDSYKPAEHSPFHYKITVVRDKVQTTLYFINGMFCAFERRLTTEAPPESPVHGPFNAKAFCERIEKALGEYDDIQITCRAELASGIPITEEMMPPPPGEKIVLVLEVVNQEQVKTANRDGAGALKELYNKLEEQLISR